MEHGPSVTVFLAQIVVLLTVGRIAGEAMQRIGQPPLIGQIVAGVLLGPSVLGALAPALHGQLFPAAPEQKAMLDAAAQLGIFLLLLLTGMETDLSVFRQARRPAISISLTGILVPFACGVVTGFFLPQSLLPDPGRRLVTALFLGTALAVSSVKIVALVVRDLGFLRRTVGQVILAAAILDDTLGWIIMSVIFGLAKYGAVDLATVSRAVLGTALFLALSFTLGRRVVFRLIRWSNDTLQSEMAPISMILAIGGALALLTELIGVHFVLGAFIAGILIGQSPILTRQIETQLRGLIVALFMPVFFALVGVSTDLAALARPQLALLTGGLILLASVGKFCGAFLGGRIGGLSGLESFAVGCGMNARGSTEVIVATIGLSMGALNENLFSAIVAMAVVTTLAMPPSLRWALGRLPVKDEERSRLEREEVESQAFLSRVERLLVAVDESPSGLLASRLVGLVAGVRRIPTTILHVGGGADDARAGRASRRATDTLKAGIDAGDRLAVTVADKAEVVSRAEARGAAGEAIETEARKGYGLLVIGREPAAQGSAFDAEITRSVNGFAGAFAIAIARGRERAAPPGEGLKILVAVTGTRVSLQGAEFAVALAQASRGTVTALYVRVAGAAVRWRERFGRALAPRNSAVVTLREIQGFGELYGVAVNGETRTVDSAAAAIVRYAREGGYALLVMGVSPRPADRLFFGEVPAQVLEQSPCSLLFVSGEAAAGSRGGHEAAETRSGAAVSAGQAPL
ncbi:MAG: cation:proton antiporter [Proteobacteria bacterium]|nr:cation:proton antiporter [Pseudomonadota bacterium]